ncbi:MAG: DUF4397 domain-containing protein [Thermomicrobiales bacterium]
MIRSFSARVGRIAIALAFMAGFGVMALGSGASAQADDARVRITHASPDAPAVDIWVNGEPAITNLAFGQATDVIALPAGTYDVAVTVAGSADTSGAVIEASLTLEAGAGYDVVAAGYLAEIGAQIYPLDLSPVTEGNARLQVIHASPDAPEVDVTANGSALVEGLAFPDSSGFLEVPAGSYDVQVLLTSGGAVALDLPGTVLEAGQVYVVMAIGEAGAGTLTALPLVAPADSAVGGTASTSETVTHTPSTGIGTLATETSNASRFFALAAGALVVLAAMMRKATAPVRG